MPRVSIGLPVYNGERYLREAVDSILNQTYRDLELIISDNASTDATALICQEYVARDPRVRYTRQPHNVGAAANYNHVFALATGEYFKWAAHDDWCAPTYIERCVQVLDRDPEVVLAYTRARVIDDTVAPLEDFDDNFHLLASRPSDRLHQCFLAGRWVFHPVFGLFRRATLARTPLIADYVGADLGLLVHVVLAGKCHEVADRLFHRREHQKRSGNLPLNEFARWWNPANRARVRFPYWRRLREYHIAVAGSRIPASDKVRCSAHVLRWAYWHRGLLLEDLKQGAVVGSRVIGRRRV
jgi:glycosyltransferase involved in cell wall biosynthesis